MTPTPALYGLLALLIVLWSSNFVFAKFALREMPLATVVALRYIVSGICMLPLMALAWRRSHRKRHYWTWRNARALLGVGLLGLVGNQVLFLIGLSMTSVAHAAIITALSPVLVLTGAVLTGIEKITKWRLIGVLTAVCGVVVLQFSRGAAGGASWTGDAVMLVSVLVFSAFNLLGKPVAERFGSVTMNAFAYCGAGLLAIPVLTSNWSHSQHASTLAWIGIGYMAVCSSVVGYLIYAYALRHLPASRVSVVVYLQPVLASLLAVVMLGERPGAGFVPAAALVLSGVYTVERFS